MKSLTALIVFLNFFSSFAQQGKHSVIRLNFEGKTELVHFENNPDNIWQIAKTKKFNSDSSRSVSYVIVTDSIRPYPVKNNSSFQITLPIDKSTSHTNLSLWHKFDMDTLSDIGRIEVSYDLGKTWLSIRKFPAVDYLSNEKTFYEDIKPVKNKKGPTTPDVITGNSQGWQQMNFKWYWRSSEILETNNLPKDNVPGDMIVRFSFSSDRIQTNKEGWMIDDIVYEQQGRVNWVFDSCALAPHKNYPVPFPMVRQYTFDGVSYGPNIRIEAINGEVIFEDIQNKNQKLKPTIIVAPFTIGGVHSFIIKTGAGTMIERIFPEKK